MKTKWMLGVLLMLAACAPQEQRFVTTSTDIPALQTDVFKTADGVYLPYRSWKAKSPRAIVIALHGMNDYSRAFAQAGEFLQARDISVYAYDQRGFGAGVQPGIWGNNANLTQDLRQFIAVIGKHYPHLPIYVLGESMGGAVAIAALADNDMPQVKGLILSAPAVWGGDSMNPLYRGALWTLAHTAPSYTMTGSDLKILASDNIPMLIALGKDPLIIKATRTDAIYGLVGMMDEAYDAISQLNMPILLLYGANDQVIRRDPLELALARFNHPILFAYYPKGYHMLLRDLHNDIVLRDVVSWIHQPNKPLPSGAGKTISPQ